MIAAVTLAVMWWREKHPVISDLPVPPPGYGTTLSDVPCADLPEDKRAGSGCADFVPDPICPSGVVDPDLGKCNCPPGQQRAKDNLTGAGSCYNPKDPSQLKEHLAECSPTPNAPEKWKRNPPVADRRGIRCNEGDRK